MTADQKLDEALKQTFPASDAFWLPPENALPPQAADGGALAKRGGPSDQPGHRPAQ